jgi:membrane peptidoglycan carboxypeptidase
MQDRAQNVPAVLRLLLGLVVLSTVAGLLLAGIAVPVVGAGGQVAKGGVDYFDDLPSKFDASPLAQQSRILDAQGRVIANPYDENRIIVPLAKIAPIMQKAQIAIEDARFYQHGGLDVRGLSRALLLNLKKDDVVQGGSTLTQQYVKATLLSDAARREDKAGARAAVAQTAARKLQELKYAIDVEERFTKDQILEGYLNLVNYGDQANGVEAAALNYFAVPASQLNLGQAALLAGIVKSPTAYNPVINPKQSQTRRNQVLDAMQRQGYASAAEVAAAKKVPVTAMLKRQERRGVCLRSAQPYFCAYLIEWLKKSPEMAALGKTPAERLKRINQGGLIIRTSLNRSYQQAAQTQIGKAVAVNNKQNLAGAVSMIEPGTGKILAMAQATDFREYQTNLLVDTEFGGGPNGYQIGSTAKIFALVEALERGMPLESAISIPAVSKENPLSIQPSEIRGGCGMVEPWPVRNDFPVPAGSYTFRKAITQSINVFFAKLTAQLGPCTVRDTMLKMGLHRADGKAISNTPAGIALGAGESTPMSLASAIATLAAGGKYCEPHPVTSITTADRKAIKVPAPRCKQVISADVAAGVTDLLQSVAREGSARGSFAGIRRPIAGKTGTTNNQNQLWFSGYIPQVATVVWVGNLKVANASGDLYSLDGKCFNAYGCLPRVYGSTVAAPVWGKIMEQVTKGLPVKRFPSPGGAVVRGNLQALPNVIGRPADDAAQVLSGAGYRSHVAGEAISLQPAGTVVYTDPAGAALAGADIGLFVSTGLVGLSAQQQPPLVPGDPRLRTPGRPGRPKPPPPPPPP